MQNRVENIQAIARRFKDYEANEEAVYDAINRLDHDTIKDLIENYKDVLTSFKPVNLLRYEVLSRRLEQIEITPQLIADLKDRMRAKDTDYFSRYGEQLTAALNKYRVGVRDIFANWQNAFRIFYPFFYSSKLKNQIEEDLDKIAGYLLKTIRLTSFTYHYVGFNGATNFGASDCWIALFPKNKVSHRKSYQLFLRIEAELLEAGLMAGWDISARSENDVEQLITLAEAEQKLQQKKKDAIEKNNHLVNFWKFAPGEGGKYWEEFFQKGIMAIGWDKLSDLTPYDNSEELAQVLGIQDPENSNEIWNLENFRDAAINDLVIANRGKRKCLGIGIITGEYRYDPSRSFYKHTRPVRWVIDKAVEFEKTIFRPDTFSPTLKWDIIKKKYLEIYPELESALSDLEKDRSSIQPSITKTIEGKNYWWLNANPKIWSIDSYDKGDIQSYTSHNEKGNKRRIYKYFQEVQPGDIVIGYESTPVKSVKAIFEITEALHHDDNEGEIISFEIVEKVAEPIEWTELRSIPELTDCKVFVNNQGSLFKLTVDEYEIIRDLIDERNIIVEAERDEKPIRKYSLASALQEIFLEEKELQNILKVLRYRKNIILQGPPGVGKTFIAKKLAYIMIDKTDDNRIAFIQFHQSYAYEDFIQGIRPDDSGNGFRVKNGIFFEFCKKAERDPGNDYFFVIDEINRGNLAKIFGELMMLIEADKRGKNYRIPLTYSAKDDAPFSVPENLYLIGTMNTADRSLALVDYALRRRFAFIDLYPMFNQKFKQFIQERIDLPLAERIISNLTALNEIISGDKNLGPGFQIGHSFFCNLNLPSNAQEWYDAVIDHEIAPLLREYWFDDPDQAEKQIEKLKSR